MCFANMYRRINRNAPQRLQVKAASSQDLIFINFRPGTMARSQVTFLENCVYRGKVGSIIYREIGIYAIVIITIRKTFNSMCCDFNEGQGGVG